MDEPNPRDKKQNLIKLLDSLKVALSKSLN